MANNIWPAGSVLQPLNVAWTSGNGRAILRLQEDRNLVLYKDGKAVYQAPSAFARGNAAITQDDETSCSTTRIMSPCGLRTPPGTLVPT